MYPDDVVLVAQHEDLLDLVVNAFVELWRRRKLNMNAVRGKVMVVERD